MNPRKPLLFVLVALSGCFWGPRRFSTPTENDLSVVFPVSVGRGLFEVDARGATYDLDGEVLRALMLAGNDYLPTGLSNPPCWARLDSLEYRFTRRENVIFVYVSENASRCGRTPGLMHSGAKYAISADGRILRRIVDGMDEDQPVWRLSQPDGGTVTVIAQPGTQPKIEDLEKPDSTVLKVVTDPVDMPGVLIFERLERTQPVLEGPGAELGGSWMPLDAGASGENTPTADRDGGV